MAAIGVMLEAKTLGIGIPADIAVVGYDNLELAAYVTPSLTTISQPAIKMGERAVLTAIEAIGRKVGEPYVRIVFPPELIVRESA
jgi:LacI family transcriptional regulator